MIQLYICFSICYLTIYVVRLSQAFEGSSILLQTLIEWLIVLIDVLVYYCGNNLLRRLNAWLRGCRWWKSEISQNAKMCVRQHLWSWCLPAWNVSSVSFSTDADWPADFFFLICDFYYEQFGFGGEISEIMWNWQFPYEPQLVLT